MEYYESIKISNSLEQKESFDETKDDNIVTDDTNSLKYALNDLTSIIAAIATFHALLTYLSNIICASNAQDFYNVSSELFYYDRNFNLIVSIFIFGFTSCVLIIPFSLVISGKVKILI